MEKEKNEDVLKKALIIIGIAVILGIIIAVVIITLQSNSGETTFKEYVEATFTGKTDKMMELTDLKAILAWKNCGREPSKFKEEYDKIQDKEAEDYKEKYREKLISSYKSYNSTFGGNMEINVTKVEKPENLGNDLEKYKGKIQIKMFNIENETDMTMIIYNGKYVVEVSN